MSNKRPNTKSFNAKRNILSLRIGSLDGKQIQDWVNQVFLEHPQELKCLLSSVILGFHCRSLMAAPVPVTTCKESRPEGESTVY